MTGLPLANSPQTCCPSEVQDDDRSLLVQGKVVSLVLAYTLTPDILAVDPELDVLAALPELLELDEDAEPVEDDDEVVDADCELVPVPELLLEVFELATVLWLAELEEAGVEQGLLV